MGGRGSREREKERGGTGERETQTDRAVVLLTFIYNESQKNGNKHVFKRHGHECL